MTYASLHQQSDRRLSKNNAVRLMETYMIAFLAGVNTSEWERSYVEQFREDVKSTYTYWPHFEELLHDTLKEVMPLGRDFTFSDITRILEIVSERVGRRTEEGNCQDLQKRLIHMEEAPGTGRVRLRDFYSSYLNNGSWQFQESVGYLRHLGVLDESDPAVARVIIPNYRNMQANCLNVSSFYDLCCIDACEAWMEHMESKIQAPHATPEVIISIVSELPSAHLPANRTLSAALVEKLQDVAEHHGGWVPLHGRLFAQWMHFAYPRECPYPRPPGTAESFSSSEWFEESGTGKSMSPDQMRDYIESGVSTSASAAASGRDEVEDEEGLCSAQMWVMEEQLVDAVNGPATSPPASRSKVGIARKTLLFCAFAAVVLSSLLAMRRSMLQAATALMTTDSLEPWWAKLASSKDK